MPLVSQDDVLRRQRMLERIRAAVQSGNRYADAAQPGPRGDLGYQGSSSPDLAEGFGEAVRRCGGHFHRVARLMEVPRVILPILENAGARLIGLSAEPLLLDTLQLARRLQAFGLEVWHPAMPQLAEPDGGLPPAASELPAVKETLFALDAGITGVDALIAETGTVVLSASRARPRSLSLLPPLYIAVAGSHQIVPDLLDWFAQTPARLPSAFTFITGPSKTGDIELTLVTGVHGPGEVHVIVFDTASQAA